MEIKSIRSFFAIAISPDCRKKINSIQQELKKIQPSGIRWVNIDNLHVTLKFFGKFDSKLIPNIFKLIETGLSTTCQFDLKFQNLGVFPNKIKPKMIWVGLDYPIELIEIFRKIENVAMELGYPKEEQGFSPHVTIGRVRNDADDHSEIGSKIEKMVIGEICQSPADRIVFYQSSLTPSGPVYSELFHLPLKR